MTRSDREHLAKRVVQYYTNVANQQTALTVNHFLAEKVPRQTIYNIIRKYDASGIVGDKARSGRPRKISSGQRIRLKRLVNHQTGVSLRKIASKFGVHRRTIQRELKAMDIVYRKKKRAPRYTEKQLEEVPTRARRLYRTLLKEDFDLVMDDEKYFSLTKDSVSTNRGFYTSDPNITPANVKFKRTQKYSPKILVWIALSEKGTSEPFFAEQKQAINESTYLNYCIKRRLIPFIKHYHKSSEVLFWPDLATSHYSSSVTQFLEEQNIHLVPKEQNPQNCPQARPVETLWSILEEKIYTNGWEAKTLEQLKRRIKQKLKEIDMKSVQTMFSSIKRQLRKIADKGPYAACSF
jgi:transposase